MTCETLTIGPAAAEERCAQLGITELFQQANLLELGCYRAALLACHNGHGLASVDLDSAGFVLAVKERGIPWSSDDCIRLAGSFPFRRFASLDLCCETEIAHDFDEVLDRIARTIRLNHARRVRELTPALRAPSCPSCRRAPRGLPALLKRDRASGAAGTGSRRRQPVPPACRRSDGEIAHDQITTGLIGNG